MVTFSQFIYHFEECGNKLYTSRYWLLNKFASTSFNIQNYLWGCYPYIQSLLKNYHISGKHFDPLLFSNFGNYCIYLWDTTLYKHKASSYCIALRNLIITEFQLFYWALYIVCVQENHIKRKFIHRCF